ncbi:glycosyltransferase family 2 protein [Tsukamurella sp. 8F]|uniref:glycosyltransferase family 2 protein n=1 Tax=unclassified Tsukamurella TaxID=2633480 RepID=UPI0023BA2FB5|nr:MULTISPECIES: glycosyltransferase family 2 protein [unclassified Tsukamurella]MDF0529846.1 glycosyltransferase family 2 protein [Tsukamurella sp. 8J]MDF0587038.1 glycosyltransferase family 2 protein [Tsukamurella sp. 8F]
MAENPTDVTVIIPCRNESRSIGAVVSAVPGGFGVLVVDNGSTDRTDAAARDAGARVVTEPEPGYGAAVHTGIVAAGTPIVCTIDGDGSFDPADLTALVGAVRRGADLAVGRRRPAPGAWPWHARAGSALIARSLRRRYGIDVHDIAPLRAARRDELLQLGIRDRRSGYPVELLTRAARARWDVREFDIAYGARTAGRSKVSGSVRGSAIAAADFLRSAL